jgi:E3 ubiquitin-protein ligase HUWE1
LKQTSPNKPKLPQMVYRFLEKNRALVNACLHWTPSLLDGSFKFLLQAPRLVDFEFKQKEFRFKVNQLRRHAEQVDLAIGRKTCFAESFNLIRARTPDQLRGPMHIRFRDEEGADAGGLTREWFQIIGEEIVNEGYALFVPSSEGTTFQPNPLSDVNPDHLLFFKFVGRVIGLALLHDVPLDVHLTRAVYRHFVGIEPGLVDIQSIDPALYNSLQEILKLDLSEHDLCLYFSITLERFDSMEDVELIPGGADIPVTNENKKDYVRRRCQMRMTKLIEKQLIELMTGFYEIIPRHLITPFSEQELELLICGMPDVDVEDLRCHTEYQGYSASAPQIRWFWECVAGMSQQDRANLLQFATGCSKVPPGGFANLAGASGTRSNFSIMRVDCDTELLPVAHTCFNRIDLPPYPSSEVLRQKLMVAITLGSKGFALV